LIHEFSLPKLGEVYLPVDLRKLDVEVLEELIELSISLLYLLLKNCKDEPIDLLDSFIDIAAI
jgi:hypothetical protein